MVSGSLPKPRVRAAFRDGRGKVSVRGYLPLTGILGVFFLAQMPAVVLRHPGWDESVYVGLGKYFASGGAVGLYSPIRPPVLPLVTGLAWRVADPLWLSRFLEVMGAVALIAAVWWLTDRLGGPIAGVCAAALLALTPVFVGEAASILTEVPSALLATLAVAAALKQRFVVTGVLAATAFMTRFAAGLFLPVLLVYLALRRDWRGAAIVGATFAVTCAPYLLGNALFNGSALGPLIEASRFAANPENVVPGTWANVTYYAALVLTNPALLFALAGLRRETFLVGAAAAVPFVFHTVIASKEAIYFILPLPFIAILAGIGLVRVLRMAPARAAFVGAAGIALLTLAVTVPVIARELTDARYVAHPAAYRVAATFPGPILTSDPRVVALWDKLAIPFYQTHSSVNGDVVFAQHEQDARVALFNPDAFLCGVECEPILANLQRQLDAGWQPFFADGTSVVYLRR